MRGDNQVRSGKSCRIARVSDASIRSTGSALAEDGGSLELIRSYLRIADDWDPLAVEVDRFS